MKTLAGASLRMFAQFDWMTQKHVLTTGPVPAKIPLPITVDASAEPPTEGVFIPSRELTDKLHIVSFLPSEQRAMDSLRLMGAPHEDWWPTLKLVNFAFVVPSELIGSTFYLRAAYPCAESGVTYTAFSPGYHVVGPCSRSDSMRVLGSYINSSWRMREHERAVALGDSMMCLGWTDVSGLEAAETSAGCLGRHDKALEFLDYSWTTTGRTSTENDGTPPYSPSHRAAYEKWRVILLQRIGQQQQEQQQH